MTATPTPPAAPMEPFKDADACLHCNYTDMNTWRDEEAAEGQQWFYVCGNCGARGPFASSSADAIAAFNTRTPPHPASQPTADERALHREAVAMIEHLSRVPYRDAAEMRLYIGHPRYEGLAEAARTKSPAAVLTSEERETVAASWRTIGRNPQHHHANMFGGKRVACLLAIIDRLTGKQEPTS